MKRSIQNIAIAFLVTISAGFLQAGDIKQFKIDLPEKIATGTEVMIAIAGLDANKKAITRDSRELSVKIANGGQTVEKMVTLSRGKISVKHTFQVPGAAMVTVSDPDDAMVVDYKAFVVEAGVEVLK